MKIYCSLILSLLVLTAVAQQKPTDVDKSPLDVSYYPPGYPILKMNGSVKDLPVARVIYSRPQKNGRTIFDGIVKYGEIWRMGANEATEIEFFKPVKFGGKPIAKGRYTMFAICQENKWTVILNNDNYVWGLAYNERKDALRVEVPVQKNADDVDALTIYFDNGNPKTGNLNILWEKTKVSIPISL
ncbi:DUF2911 domain-containing protein [Foetidibacter luteolus]|uniref:DUF2911 domain-containing protein n=1 Tax=Foetidibacter luteolus TaxID=2608880 RepID=UPI00129B2C6F|nr:DUF2911 domain-containing protein [Foetidibacter luteolus]